MKKILYLISALLILTSISKAKAQTQELARVKAVFILNFIKYSDHQAANHAGEFVVGIYQDEQMYRELVKICGNSYHGKKVVVKLITDFNTPVHLLFIPEKHNHSYISYIKKTGPITNTLIVGDKSSDNTMISFEVHNSKFYFRLHDQLLANSGIKLAASIREIAINNMNM